MRAKQEDKIIRIYASMLISEAFTELSNRQKVLYMCCKSQISDIDKTDTFCMDWGQALRYKLYRPSMHANFYRDMKALCEHGLIEKVSKIRGRTSYIFSEMWQTWKAEP